MKCELCKLNKVSQAIKKTEDGLEQDFFVCGKCALKESSGGSGAESAVSGHAVHGAVPNVNVFMDATVDIAAALRGVAGKRCPSCGFVVTENVSYRKLGCPECYKTFKKEIQKRQLADGYCGKRPQEADSKVEVVALKSQIEDAVRESRYDDVFRLKLQLEVVESRGKGSEGYEGGQ